jgi:hypothetical protein
MTYPEKKDYAAGHQQNTQPASMIINSEKERL